MAKLRILIADDESIIRLGLKRILEDLGYQVVAVAADGDEALDLIRSTKPDLAILDIKMPGKDGLEVAHIIREEQPMPVVILTAYSDRELVERARDAEAMAYLVKPIRDAELMAAIEIAITRFEEKARLQQERENLQEALRARELIDKAKRLLMKKEGLQEHEAFMLIHRQSRNTRRPMREIAEEILASMS